MVAYSFKAQFVDLIAASAKRQTLRSPRRRHARAGETLQLYYAMRTRQCRLIGTATCSAVAMIRLNLVSGRVEFPETGPAITTISDLDHFARQDGFNNWSRLVNFWADNHADIAIWEGVIIRWSDFAAP